MLSHPRSPEDVAKTGPAGSSAGSLGRDWRRLAAAVVLGAGLLALGITDRSAPAVAQLKVGTPAETLSFADIVDRVKPAVVSVSTTNEVPKVADNKPRGGRPFEGIPGLPEDHPLNEFFKNLPKAPRPQQQRPRQAAGLRLRHLARRLRRDQQPRHRRRHQDPGQLRRSGNKFDAELIGTDQRTDLALLKIEPKKPLPVRQVRGEDPARRRLGDRRRQSVRPRRHGDGRHRLGAGPRHRLGPLRLHADRRGREPRQLRRPDLQPRRRGGRRQHGDLQPLGRQRRHRLRRPGRDRQARSSSSSKKGGAVSRGWLGVKIQNVDEDTRRQAWASRSRKGALVSEVLTDGPAAAAGLKVEDAILQIERQEDRRQPRPRAQDRRPSRRSDGRRQDLAQQERADHSRSSSAPIPNKA